MPSKAPDDLAERLKDIDQLITAHDAVVRMRRAKHRARHAGDPTEEAVTTLATLVSPLGRGRVAKVEALNRAAVVLLSAHLEGYIEDLYAQAASSLLQGRVQPRWIPDQCLTNGILAIKRVNQPLNLLRQPDKSALKLRDVKLSPNCVSNKFVHVLCSESHRSLSENLA